MIIFKKFKILKKIKKDIIIFFNSIEENYWIIKNKYKIKEYHQNIKKRKAKGVVYTCITGNYEKLKMHKYFDKNWDYICYTDNKKLLEQKIKYFWKIKELEYNKLDNIRNARWHKINPYKFLKDYEKSLWIDGTIIIKDFTFFKYLKEKEIFISCIHPERNCVYEEAKTCLNLKKDDENLILKQMQMIKKENYPSNNGLYATGIIYRKHNDNKIEKLSIAWWYWIKKYSRRDQLSINYICWKLKIPLVFFTKKDLLGEKNKYIKIVHH